jgi:predicted nuclease of predicted toxin-antitoxin system
MWKPGESITDEKWKEFKSKFKKKARFLVDENIGEEVATVLRDLGYNTVFVGDIGLLGRSDEDVFAYAWKTKRFILTHDDDFLDNLKFPFHRNHGVIVLPGAKGNGTLEGALADVLRLIAPYATANVGVKIKIAEDKIWKIRGFNKLNSVHWEKRIKLGKNGSHLIWDSNM